jgi:2-(1,2-epoxy-1,2-dihydrophenyl)acetyl-CoA isomerase
MRAGSAMATLRLSFPAEGIARLDLCRPAARNALASATLAELDEALQAVAASKVRALTILAEGDDFSVGGDLHGFAGAMMDNPAALVRADSPHIRGAFGQLHDLDAAVVVGARGIVTGGAVGLLAGADLVVLGEDARINLAYARIGASPDAGTSWLLPRLVGHQRAFAPFAFNETIDASTARQAGLAERVVAPAEIESVAMTLAQRLAAMPPVTLAAIKRLIGPINRIQIEPREGTIWNSNSQNTRSTAESRRSRSIARRSAMPSMSRRSANCRNAGSASLKETRERLS